MTTAEAEEKLTRHATTQSFTPAKATSVIRVDNNFVECNDPIEDRHAESYLDRSKLYAGGIQEGGKDAKKAGIKMFSIIDGHSGWECAQLVSQTLHPMILLSLRSLYAGHHPPTSFDSPSTSTEHLKAYISGLFPGIKDKLTDAFPFLSTPAKVEPGTIQNSIISAFLALDHQIVSSAPKLIPHLPTKPGQPNVRPIVSSMVGPAVSGACAIHLLVDEEREEIYVGNTGDCRAVAGYWVEGKHEGQGGWRCEVLSDDLMGDNEAEVER